MSASPSSPQTALAGLRRVRFSSSRGQRLSALLHVSPNTMSSPSGIGCWMLDVECWMFDVGCWMFDVGCWMFDVGCWMLAVGCWMFDVGCSMLDVRCWMLDVRCSMFCPTRFPHRPASALAH